ncbi:hypothetical protein [Bradyrhizobium japonicum]|uniref:hypothetical protein n=1 Tax=Bradyrhizobium japonicum TaxID=375 RepID=UPI001BA9247B|nr:hypothetical protein [Bradyrhizobium japonicum]MBR0911498.1 hypothetical protein [Bradyrhizobium japonicum]
MAKISKRTSGDPTFPLRDKSAPDGRTDFLLVHVTAVGAAREIIRCGQIEARQCTVFHRALSYFFALRPAYRLKNGGEPTDQLDRFPFVFVVDPAGLGAPHHVYPFDTGGAISGAFDEQANEFVFLEDYGLRPNYEAVSGQIGWAFDTRAAYYDGELRQDVESSLAYHEAGPRSFLRIAALASVGSNRPDQRASAIEVAFNRHVPLKGNVKFAVMPRQFLEDPRGDNRPMIDGLTSAGIGWTFYEWEPNLTPDEFRQEITRLVREHLVKDGQL